MTFFVYGIFDSSDWGIAKYVGAASRLSRPLKHERRCEQGAQAHRSCS